ncbi:MAG: N-acetyltransferase [Oscillospiraceae bacterium]|jgi:putative acetyltransferase|nr:N-acetyltransferase [Oscillospiraceae bacterium]MDD3261804.1 N-acetyltransferase [Oscillospiraceae bacterium]
MDVTIRKEAPGDRYAAEYMTKKAFWNLHFPGCSEHYLVHRLRRDAAYLPQLSRVAEYKGQIVGAIYCAKAFVRSSEGKQLPVLTFGPLCVEPDFQKRGIGGQLLQTVMRLAGEAGWKGVVIYGETSYYPRFGFAAGTRFGITDEKGENPSALMAAELIPGGLAEISGQFYEPSVYINLPQSEVDQYDKLFPYLEKRVLPGQWKL